LKVGNAVDIGVAIARVVATKVALNELGNELYVSAIPDLIDNAAYEVLVSLWQVGIGHGS